MRGGHATPALKHLVIFGCPSRVLSVHIDPAFETPGYCQESLRDSHLFAPADPALKTPVYCQESLRDVNSAENPRKCLKQKSSFLRND